jgi:hypothetical protein
VCFVCDASFSSPSKQKLDRSFDMVFSPAIPVGNAIVTEGEGLAFVRPGAPVRQVSGLAVAMRVGSMGFHYDLCCEEGGLSFGVFFSGPLSCRGSAKRGPVSWMSWQRFGFSLLLRKVPLCVGGACRRVRGGNAFG